MYIRRSLYKAGRKTRIRKKTLQPYTSLQGQPMSISLYFEAFLHSIEQGVERKLKLTLLKILPATEMRSDFKDG